MADPRAHVSSIDSLERFRSSLIVFLERANLVIDEVSDETNRLRMWLQSDQRMFWTMEIRRRQQKLDEAQAQLLAARISALGEATHAHHQAVRNAHNAVRAAEEKLNAVKQWTRHYDSRVAPLTKQLSKLDNILNGDMEKAVHFLTESIKNLQDYAELRPTNFSGGPEIDRPAPESDSGSESTPTTSDEP
ncbi:MAG: hypothetical protein KDM64_07125 [Verrucomicrobiae bacterium]|nr:hypothetical protein [Verrucomicrobiae bacterium]